MGFWGSLGGAIVKNIPVIGSVAGGIMDMVSQQHANQANAQNVDKQIAFQKEQSGTQYQRATADMKAAGLNPALAYEQGGNVAATGAAATAQPITQNSASKFATAMSVYNDLATGTAQRDLLRSQSNAQDANALLARTQAAAARPDAILGGSEDYVSQYQRSRLAEQRAKQTTSELEPGRFRAAINSLVGGTAQSYAEAERARTQSRLNEQQFTNDWFLKNVSPYLNSSAQTLRALTSGLNFTQQLGGGQ